VVIHGLIRAEDGRKMSKSLGNAIDPIDVASEYGADALRLTLIQAAAPNQDVPFQIEWVDAARRFGNKLWNAVRFTISHLGEGAVPATGGYPEAPGPEASWVLSRLHDVTAEVDAALDEYRFSDAYAALYSFAWSEVFDWYLELAKAHLRAGDAATRDTLGVVVRDLLKLFHPVIPYLTEELWQHLVGDGFIAAARWPQPPRHPAPEGFEAFREVVGGVRRFRAEHRLSPRHPLTVTILDPDGVMAPWWGPQLKALAGIEPMAGTGAPAGAFSRIVAGSLQALISLEGVVDVAAERVRLDAEIAELETARNTAATKLANPQFTSRAPAEIVAKEQDRVDSLTATLAKLTAQRSELG
jgi:valyl-tRNA synthetase